MAWAQTKAAAKAKARDGETLKEAADGLGIYVGAAMKYKNFLSDDDGQYGEVAAREFDLITPENYCKPKMMLKSTDDTLENSYVNYDGCHYLNDYAIENDMAFRGHALVWPAPGKYPDWFEELEGDDMLEEWMIDYIIEVMHEMGDMYAWDVVNEAISNSDAEYIKTSVLSGIDDFICTAFSTAKAVANENGWETLMFYNEYDFESMYGDFATKSDKVYTLMADLVENDCGVDGVGFQTHIDIGFSDENIDGIQDNFDRLADLGLYVQYTEIDVRCGKGPNNAKYTECPIEEGEEWTSDMLATQSAIYRKLLNTCIYSANCLSFETWGYTDKYCFLSEPQNGMPFDADYNAKAAVKQMLNKLNNTPRTANAVEARLAGEYTS